MSERLERYQEGRGHLDEEFAKSIWNHLGSRKDLYWDDCDACYYDGSVAPEEARALKIWDCYLIYGVTEKGEIIKHWIARWELDK